MDTFTVLSYLGKCMMDSSIITLLIELYTHLTSEDYKKILEKDPKLNEMVVALTKKLA